jgi:hypothetical protein
VTPNTPEIGQPAQNHLPQQCGWHKAVLIQAGFNNSWLIHSCGNMVPGHLGSDQYGWPTVIGTGSEAK